MRVAPTIEARLRLRGRVFDTLMGRNTLPSFQLCHALKKQGLLDALTRASLPANSGQLRGRPYIIGEYRSYTAHANVSFC